jgi:hypothetical protein
MGHKGKGGGKAVSCGIGCSRRRGGVGVDDDGFRRNGSCRGRGRGACSCSHIGAAYCAEQGVQAGRELLHEGTETCARAQRELDASVAVGVAI